MRDIQHERMEKTLDDIKRLVKEMHANHEVEVKAAYKRGLTDAVTAVMSVPWTHIDHVPLVIRAEATDAIRALGEGR